LSLPSLQPVAPAYVPQRNHEKANRQQHEHNVLHKPSLRENSAADFHRA
jgi:hypothetical protein